MAVPSRISGPMDTASVMLISFSLKVFVERSFHIDANTGIL
jgi:hypothetical protein